MGYWVQYSGLTVFGNSLSQIQCMIRAKLYKPVYTKTKPGLDQDCAWTVQTRTKQDLDLFF